VANQPPNVVIQQIISEELGQAHNRPLDGANAPRDFSLLSNEPPQRFLSSFSDLLRRRIVFVFHETLVFKMQTSHDKSEIFVDMFLITPPVAIYNWFHNINPRNKLAPKQYLWFPIEPELPRFRFFVDVGRLLQANPANECDLQIMPSCHIAVLRE
jgi:hypothetical protein